MRNIKVILLILTGFILNSVFNACGEVSFSNNDIGLSKIEVSEDNLDEQDEVAIIDEIFGIDNPEEEALVEVIIADEEDSNDDDSSDENSSDDDDDSSDDELAFEDEDYKNKKVVICHISKGNNRARTLMVSWAAVRAHVDENHHRHEGDVSDYFGPCEEGSQ